VKRLQFINHKATPPGQVLDAGGVQTIGRRKFSRECVRQSLLFMFFSVQREIPTDIDTCAARRSLAFRSIFSTTRFAW